MRFFVVDHETCTRTGQAVCAQVVEVRDDGGRPTILEPRLIPCWGPAPGRPDARAELADLLSGWFDDPETIVANQRLAFDLFNLAQHLGLHDGARRLLAEDRGRCTEIRQRLLDIARPAILKSREGAEVGDRQEPQKWAPHALLKKRVRIDGDGTNPRSQVNLAELVGRHLGLDISASKNDPRSPRMRFGELLGVPVDDWDRVVPGAREYALADVPLAARVLIAQARPVVTAPVPGIWGEAWHSALIDEPAQIRGAIGFEAMTWRGMAVDLQYVRARRRELHAAAAVAEDRMVEGGVLRDELRWKKRPPAGADPQTRKRTKSVAAIRERVERALRKKGLPVRETPGGEVSADGEAVYAAVGPARLLLEVDSADGRFEVAVPADEARAALAGAQQAPGTADGDGWLAPGPLAPEGLRPQDGAAAIRLLPSRGPEADLEELLTPKLLRALRRWIDAAEAEAASSLDPDPEGRAAAAVATRLGRAIASADDPGLAALAVHGKATKFDGDFLAALDAEAEDPALRAAGLGRARPGFSYVLDTGRASGFGAIRQNMPKEGGVRECFVPRPGYALAIVDFAGIELVTLAYAMNEIFGRECELSKAINAGMDCHTLLAAEDLLEIPYEEGLRRKAAKDAKFAEVRDQAKAGNFGFGGGMGAEKFVEAKRREGLVIPLPRAVVLREKWKRRWKMDPYFKFCSSGTKGGWGWQRQIWSGRIRAGLIFTQFANGWFQALAGDGAKLACWRIYRACFCEADGLPGSHPRIDGMLRGCYPLHFIHDEFIAEVPDPGGGVAEAHLERLGAIMRGAMRSVMPGMRVETEGKLCRTRWTKR